MTEKDKYGACREENRQIEYKKSSNCLAHPIMALILVCALSFFQQMIINGLTSTAVSTVERRFQLQSTETGLIVSIYDIFRALGLLVLLIPGSKISKPRWLSISAVTLSFGCFVFCLPHILASEYVYQRNAIFNYCGNVTEPDCDVTNIRNFRYTFMIAMALIGTGSSLIIVYGITYIDENVSKSRSTKYSSIYFMMGAWGPAAGYVCGGFSLKQFVNIFRDVEIDSGSPYWVGAWWLMYAISSVILILLAMPLFLIPKTLNTMGRVPSNRDGEIHRSVVKNQHAKKKSVLGRLRGFAANPTLVLSCLSNAFVASFVLGFNTFGVKYAESQFGLDATNASFVFGGTAVVFFSVSQLVSGFVLSSYKFNVSNMMKYIMICSIVSVGTSCGFFTHCTEIAFAGANHPYNGNSRLEPGNLTASCNSNCKCSTDRFQPVLDYNQIVYFSPCHAGCDYVHDNGFTYSDCKCVNGTNQTVVSFTSHLDESYCPFWKVILFVTFCGLCIFTSGLSLTPLTQITLRCIPSRDRTLAIGVQQLFVIVFGTVPGRLLTGKVIDFSCTVWSTKCNEFGSCKHYDQLSMSTYVTLLLLTECVIIVIVNIAMILTYRSAKTFPDSNDSNPSITHVVT